MVFIPSGVQLLLMRFDIYFCSVKGTEMSFSVIDFVFTLLGRTQMLQCLSDRDFLAKLHCVRQAFHVSWWLGFFFSCDDMFHRIYNGVLCLLLIELMA